MAWTRGPTIGRGSSAVVSLATRASGEIFAVKSADLSSSSILQKEESLISLLCSPYVVKCLGSNITSENGRSFFNLFLEYAHGGTLSDHIRKSGGALEETSIREHARQILLGLSYLHQQGLAHCDIKGQNILIGDGGLKLTDFGCARRVEPGAPGVFSGTPAFMAPEVARGEEQGFASDVWAFGCAVIEMATGSAPWPEMKDPAAALYRIAFSKDLPETPVGFSDAARDMLSRCLKRDPRERWTAAQLLQHPFFEPVEEESGCREIRDLTRESPTSVINQGIWDSLEESEVSENPAGIGWDSDSAAARVRALVGDYFPANSGFSGWADGEDWIMVRGEGMEDCMEVQNSEDLIQTSQDLEDEEGNQFQSSIFSVENLWINYYYYYYYYYLEDNIGCSAFFPDEIMNEYYCASEWNYFFSNISLFCFYLVFSNYFLFYFWVLNIFILRLDFLEQLMWCEFDRELGTTNFDKS